MEKMQLVQLSTKASTQVLSLEIATVVGDAEVLYVHFPICHKISKQCETQGLGFNKINMFYTLSRTFLSETGLFFFLI